MTPAQSRRDALHQRAGDDAAEREDRADREVDAAVQDHEQHADREQAVDGDVVRHGQEVRDREVVGRQEREDDDDEDQREEGAALEQDAHEVEAVAGGAGGGRRRSLGGLRHVAGGAVGFGEGAGGALVGDEAGEEAAGEDGADGVDLDRSPPARATMRRPRRLSSGTVTMRGARSVTTGRPSASKKWPSISPTPPARRIGLDVGGVDHAAGDERGLADGGADADEHEVAAGGEAEGLGDAGRRARRGRRRRP